MRKAFGMFVILFFGCGGESALNEDKQEDENCWNLPVAAPGQHIISVWLDPESVIKDDVIMQGLNAFWTSAGIQVVKSASSTAADIGIVYGKGVCKRPVMIGRLKYDYWANLDSIIIDGSCLGKIADYYKKLPAALSHALGNLMGIEAYPVFCSDGVMASDVVKMKNNRIPSRLSQGDLDLFASRNKFFAKRATKTVCYGKWQCGKFSAIGQKNMNFWADAKFETLPIEKYLNDYYKIFGRTFKKILNKQDAVFAINPWDEVYDGCSPTAITYPSLKEVYVKTGQCLEGTGSSESDATIFAHEVGHLFGMAHIPRWCGEAIMQPYVNQGACFSEADVKAWVERDLEESIAN